MKQPKLGFHQQTLVRQQAKNVSELANQIQVLMWKKWLVDHQKWSVNQQKVGFDSIIKKGELTERNSEFINKNGE